MANGPQKPADKNQFPSSLTQNPAPFTADSQDRMDQTRSQVDRILQVFRQILPSNYVSQTTGPFYTIQYQAVAERIADFQITAQEIFSDSFYDFTRSEVLYQILGMLVFPDAGTAGWPSIKGDLTYRTFLTRMVGLLLQGATKATVKSGVELLTEATVEVIERGIEARKLKGQSPWGTDDEFTFEVNVTGSRTVEVEGEEVVLDDFPVDPFLLRDNVRLVMQALKPAHTLYDLRFLFREVFGTLFSASVSYDYADYHYEDLRRYCLGSLAITGTAGETLSDKALFSDPTRDFATILPGAILSVLTGPNAPGVAGNETWPGRYRVEEARSFPVGTDATARTYTTSPTGLTGTATVQDDVVVDPSQNWAAAVEGEVLTFLEGPNAGGYRLKTLTGSNGGPLGKAPGPATGVRAAKSILRLEVRMRQAATGQSYSVSVDRLGVQVPHAVTGEDATIWFVL